MSLLRSERYGAVFLLVAAAFGLVLTNSALGNSWRAVRDAPLGIRAIGLEMSVGHWVTDGLLVVFFFIVAAELQRELTVGTLNWRVALDGSGSPRTW